MDCGFKEDAGLIPLNTFNIKYTARINRLNFARPCYGLAGFIIIRKNYTEKLIVKVRISLNFAKRKLCQNDYNFT